MDEEHRQEREAHVCARSETLRRKDSGEDTSDDEGYGESKLGGGCKHLDRLPGRRGGGKASRRGEQSDGQLDRWDGKDADQERRDRFRRPPSDEDRRHDD